MKLILPFISSTILVVLLYLAEKQIDKRGLEQKIPYMAKQLIIGILFGVLAIFSSKYGATYKDIVIDLSDAATLCGGLIFGAPAAVVSGLMAGAYRFFLGAGEYTRIAATISNILVGLIAGTLRELMFDDKKPTWIYGAGIACVCEDIRMLLIFLFHLDDATTAYTYVEKSTIPMVVGNAIAVAVALIAVALLSREKLYKRKKVENISQTFQRWLLVCILCAYALTSLFTYRLQSNITERSVTDSIDQMISDVSQDILDTSTSHLLAVTREIEEEYTASDSWDTESLQQLADSHDVFNINIINSDGIIINSNEAKFIDFDMNSGEQSAEFMTLFKGKIEYVQSYQALSYDSNMNAKYAGVLLADGTALQVGYSYAQYRKDIDDIIYDATKNRHIGSDGFIMICDEEWLVVADGDVHNGMHLSEIGIIIDTDSMEELDKYTATIGGEEYIYSFLFTEGYCIIGAIPETEAHYMRDVSQYISIIIEIIIFATLFLLVYILIKKVIINNLREINGSLAQITSGNLNVQVNVRSNAEFVSLSDDINSTVSTLKDYIAEAAARIDKELEYAKNIQCSSLPSVFPPYPDQDRFDIFAQMFTAKEVGGDFYDFYRLDDHTVAFLIADVSDKGIPAALFMMTAKTTIKDLAERKLPVNEILCAANNKLCEGNDEAMFVTACMGIFDLNTGKLQFANAGHNPPLIRHGDGSFEYIKLKGGMVLAGMEDTVYPLNEYELLPGDRIFLYTDGVTEATNADKELYGEDRLRSFVNANEALPAKELLTLLKADIDDFVGEAPQFDDITMLMFDYFKKGEN